MSKKPISDLRVVLTSLIVSIADVSLNFIVGLITGSSVMFAQALQGLSDLVTAGVLLVGVRRSRRQADAKHPFGYGREIFFWVLVAGIFMFLGTGVVSLILGYQQIASPEVVNSVWIAIGLLVFGLSTNGYSFWQAMQRLRQNHHNSASLGRVMRSSLIETKATVLVDAMGTLAAMLGLVALVVYAITNNAVFDGIGAAAVGGSMMFASLMLIKDVKDLIVGKAVDSKTLQRIRSSALQIKGVQDVLDLRTMYLGSSKLLVIIEVHFADGLDTDEIEILTDKIKAEIRHKVPQAHRVQVEVETPELEFES